MVACIVGSQKLAVSTLGLKATDFTDRDATTSNLTLLNPF
jgi:hypothetical protein